MRDVKAALCAGLGLVSCLVAGAPVSAQLVHRGASASGTVTETVTLSDTWEQGGSTLSGQPRDVLTRIDRTAVGGNARTVEVDLLLFGPWGAHLYTFDELATRRETPLHESAKTTWRALDLDDDGLRELVLVERKATARVALTAEGLAAAEPGPFFDDLAVTVRWLQRKDGTLLENDLDGNPDDPAFAALLAHEMGGPVDAALQLCAADWLFRQQQFEKARYRYQVAREWAERQLPGGDVARLSTGMPLPSIDPDDPAVTWIHAVRRTGSLPAWYQRH